MALPSRKTEIVDAVDKSLDQDKLAGALAQHRADEGALVLAGQQQNARVSALAVQLNYSGSTDPAVLENSAKDAIRRIGAGIFELGGYLALLREACAHGLFLPALERLGLAPRAAQRYIEIARRFANASTSTHLEKAGLSKLVELLPLDDGQLGDLTELGQTGELALDDVARMSVKELRAAVHKARQEADKQKNAVERLTAVNTELHEEARLVKRLPPDHRLAQIKAEAVTAQSETLALVRGALRQALIALNDAPDEASKVAFMAGLLGPVYVELDALRDEFGLPLATEGTPEWERWAAAHADATPAKRAKAN